jgi:hypothetical protein
MTILIEKEYFLWQLQKNKFDKSSQKTTLIGVFIDFQFEGWNHFAFYAHLREHGTGSVLIRTGLKLADAFFICFKEYKIFLFVCCFLGFFCHRGTPFVTIAERGMHMAVPDLG